jgi:hypothetical protein
VTGARWLILGGTIWLAGCGSSPSCMGEPIPCAEHRSEGACHEQIGIGCSWSGITCEGASVVDCQPLGRDQQACEGASHCGWSATDGACTGLTGCVFQRVRQTCERLGCSWNPDQCRLVGAPIVCHDLDQRQCGLVRGCQWK